ncbi:fibronectin type III domain-containing protein [Fulvivirgaceae bacterium BMA10]|uniref:Fibronectin type III domain-containing protein n=1 Tax=Splendidivirga corallicola TaxID=3051826 RepID=A0ABT8KPR0_9BACT|nr:fibronectin type III domain-containing protein [Fulvivirgaceae bacterium BMA10]
MKYINQLFILVITLSIVLSCKNDDEGDPVAPNQKPDNFEVTVTQVTSRSAQLDWEAVTDPDGDNITYTIWLNDEEAQAGFSDSEFLLEQLEAETDYTGKVAASDGKGGITESAFAFSTEAFTIGWKRFLGGSANDVARSIQQTDDGGYIATGHSASSDGDVGDNEGDTDIWITKLDENGNLLWETNLGGSNEDRSNAIQQTTDGGFVVAGHSASADGDVSENNGDEDYWIVKLDQSGSLVWETSLGGSDTDIAQSIQQTDDGGYVVVGHSFSSDGDVGNNQGHADYWIVKLDASGSLVWETNVGGSNEDIARSIQQTSDGGFVVAGSTSSFDGDVGGNNGEQDYWIVKLDQDGDLEWETNLGGSSPENAYEIQLTSDGEFIVAGSSLSSDGDVQSNHGLSDYWIVKLDDGGDVVWETNLGGSDTDIARSVEQTTDGGFIVTGRSSSLDGDVEDNEGSWDFWIIKLNSEGSLLWENNIGGSARENAWSVKQTADGAYIVAGSARSDDGDVGGNKGGQDFWIVKLQ